MKLQKDDNFLEFIPKRNEKFDFEILDNGIVKIIIDRNTILDKVVRFIFKTPDKFELELDEIGSFIWKNIDGMKTIEEISNLLKNEFDKKVEPLYQRLSEYIVILRNNKFIELEKI